MGIALASATAVADGGDVRRDHGFHLVAVKAVVDETHDTRSFVLDIPIAKSVLATSRRPLRMLYANRDRRSVIFADELEQLHQRHGDHFDLRHHLDTDGGFLDGDTIAAFVGETRNADFYICGPGPF